MTKVLSLCSSSIAFSAVIFGCTTETVPPKTSAPPPPSASTAAVANATAKPPPPPPSACIPPALASGPLTGFELKGGKLFVCVASGEDASKTACLSLDPTSSTYADAPGFVPAPVPGEDWPFGLATDGASAKVCLSNSPNECKDVKPGFKPNRKSQFEGAVSADGKSLFLYKYVPPAAATSSVAMHKLFGEVFDVDTGKKTASFPLPVGKVDAPEMFADQTDSWTARWFGSTHLLVSAYRCCGPAGMQAFVDPKSGKLAIIGDPSLLVQLGPDNFLLGFEERKYDADGKNIGKVSLSVFDANTLSNKALATLPNATRDEPESFVLAHASMPDGTIAIAYANPPGIVMFDPKTTSLGAPKPAPICK
jgi:hypothetical protein